MDIKNKIHNLVSVFYRNTFKTFYVNSCDGETFVKPIGVFVSLGITTSLRTLNEIKEILEENGFKATLAEISSKRKTSQFLNTLITINNIKQYETDYNESDLLLDKEKACDELSKLKSLITSEEDLQLLKELVPKISRLEELINKLNTGDGWEYHLIKKGDGQYQLFHKNINYKKDGDIEYRIGIYVSENNN